TDLSKRALELEGLLDMDRFLTFAAMEVLLVHWDGYSLGVNNYRLFHDTSREKMVFLPHGLDQLFGAAVESTRARTYTLSIVPKFGGLVAQGAFEIPTVRARYRER